MYTHTGDLTKHIARQANGRAMPLTPDNLVKQTNRCWGGEHISGTDSLPVGPEQLVVPADMVSSTEQGVCGLCLSMSVGLPGQPGSCHPAG